MIEKNLDKRKLLSKFFISFVIFSYEQSFRSEVSISKNTARFLEFIVTADLI